MSLLISELIQLIDIAWEQKKAIYDIQPNNSLGYFDFRNKVILQYKTIKRGA